MKAKLVGLKIKISETKLMLMKIINNSCNNKLKIGVTGIENVDEFCYLGSILTKDDSILTVLQVRNMENADR